MRRNAFDTIIKHAIKSLERVGALQDACIRGRPGDHPVLRPVIIARRGEPVEARRVSLAPSFVQRAFVWVAKVGEEGRKVVCVCERVCVCV